MQEELKSLKNPTRILTIIMFFAVFVSSIGANGLAELIPGIPPIFAAGVVSLAAYFISQYGTERRVVRAEDLKENEVISTLELNPNSEMQVDNDGV